MIEDIQELNVVQLPDGPFDDSILVLKSLNTKPQRKQLTAALLKINQVCRSRQREGFEAAAWVETMIEVLSEYDAPSIMDACTEWLHKSPWLPAPSELIDLSKPKDIAVSRLMTVLLNNRYAWMDKRA